MPTDPKLDALAKRWAQADAKERTNAQLYLIELADALGVERPRPAGTGYEFEFPVKVGNRDGTESSNFIDLYKEGHFVLEAKDEKSEKSANALLQKAFGQARTYAQNLAGTPPPYLMVLDVAKTLIVWDRWSGSYGGFNAGRKIDLRRLAESPEDAALLRDIWTDPQARDPRSRAAAVTKEIAARLAQLSASLETRGHSQEAVARFLMRCVFTMFAEDVGLLSGEPFRNAVEDVGFQSPDEFTEVISDLWRAMDQGKRFGLKKLLRFNGHFFQDAEAIPLTKDDLVILQHASRADWRHVEPTIFGTLLTRALDAKERHRLGAEYTPRAFVERVVRPTVEEPIRGRWTLVQAEVLQLRETGKKKDSEAALGRLRDFHGWMRNLRFLDPACGSGNFLYVTLSIVKQIELEVLREIEAITGYAELGLEEVGPWQFYGIEVKPWAREIAELTLWIGYHQFWMENHGGVQPPEPVLRDTGTLECRDAVLAWDEIVHVPEKDRPDPAARITHPVTGKPVPDPEARLPYYEYRGARRAKWPQADFIVGNPPYMGTKRMRDAFGDGYVDALRSTYRKVPDSADYVMYWWHRAAEEVAEGRTIRAGLITTNTITQRQNRAVISDAADQGACVAWAVPDHPWVDEAGAAAVRVAMTVIARDPARAVLVRVDNDAEIRSEFTLGRMNSDLTAHADVAGAASVPLQAAAGLSSFGFMINGAGFILDTEEAEDLLAMDVRHSEIVRPYRNGRDLAARPRDVYLIDFGMRDEDQARTYPVLYDIVRDRVMPHRAAKSDPASRQFWWRFARPREDLRSATGGLSRYIATPETAKHRFFIFVDAVVAPDHMLVCIASDDPFHLGVLSSTVHVTWALAAGGTLEDRPRYNKRSCFDPFPFASPASALRASIAELGERLDRHRKEAIARGEQVTMTGMYNVVEKLRSGEPLAAKERTIHEIAACGVLRDLHDELDALVAQAYGWPWPMEREEILERLVALHDERVTEEARGKVRWLRPDYQIPKFGAGLTPTLKLESSETGAISEPVAAQTAPWPTGAIEQISAIKSLVSTRPSTLDEVAGAFHGAVRRLVERHLETLTILGEVRLTPSGRYDVVPATLAAAA